VDIPLPQHAVSAWLFGKLPAHGDFVARGLDPAEREVLDHWLSAEVEAARQAHGEAFAYRYDVAPPWRFVTEEVSAWRGGAVAPSIDSAGRRFPILLSGSASDPAAAAGLAERCEETIYTALGDRWDADRTYAHLCGLAGASADGANGWWTLGNGEFSAAALDGCRPAGLLTAMLAPAEAAA
jgi:type VI secretion system protein ImpM